MFIICFFENTTISDCNIDLFKQSDIIYNNQIDGFVCFNFVQNIANELVLFFFKTCVEIVYIYFNDNKININNFKNNLIFCCIETFCQTFLKQLIEKKNSINI